MTWEQELVSAQTEIERAVFEMNRPGELGKLRREAELRYIALCVADAHNHLMRISVRLQDEGVTPFNARELKKWERT